MLKKPLFGTVPCIAKLIFFTRSASNLLLTGKTITSQRHSKLNHTTQFALESLTYYYFHAKNSSKKSKNRIAENLQHHVDHTVIENAILFLYQRKTVFVTTLCGRLISRFGCNDPFTQYFCLYRAVFLGEVENKMIGGRKKHIQTTPTRTHFKYTH